MKVIRVVQDLRCDKLQPIIRDDGLPMCDEDCPSHDGKRCRVLGYKAPQLCEPMVIRLAKQAAKVEPPALKSCPFCGSIAGIPAKAGADDRATVVRCTGCDVETPKLSLTQARAAWNRRV